MRPLLERCLAPCFTPGLALSGEPMPGGRRGRDDREGAVSGGGERCPNDMPGQAPRAAMPRSLRPRVLPLLDASDEMHRCSSPRSWCTIYIVRQTANATPRSKRDRLQTLPAGRAHTGGSCEAPATTPGEALQRPSCLENLFVGGRSYGGGTGRLTSSGTSASRGDGRSADPNLAPQGAAPEEVFWR